MSGVVFSVEVEAGASAQMHRQAGKIVRKLADTSSPSPHGHSCKSRRNMRPAPARALDLPRPPHGSNTGIDKPGMRCRAGGGAQSSVDAFPHASGKKAHDRVSKQRTGHGTQTRRGTRTSLTVSSGPFPVVSRVTTSCSPDRPRSAWPLSLSSRRLNGVADGYLRVRSSARPRIRPVEWKEGVTRCRSAPRARRSTGGLSQRPVCRAFSCLVASLLSVCGQTLPRRNRNCFLFSTNGKGR